MSSEDSKRPNSSGPELIVAEAQKISAQAKLKEAEASLAKSKTPLIDRIIMRGLIPVAITIVGPWALWTFSSDVRGAKNQIAEQSEQLKDQKVIVKNLKSLLDRSVTYQERMEEMVTKLNEVMKMSILSRSLQDVVHHDDSLFVNTVEGKSRISIDRLKSNREKIIDKAMRQAQPIIQEENKRRAREMAESAFDRFVEEQKRIQD